MLSVLNRRSFIKYVFAGLGFTLAGKSILLDVFASDKSFKNGIEFKKNFIILDAETQKIMEAFANALVPGSKETNIKDNLMKYFDKNRGMGSYIDSGLWNLDIISKNRYNKPFYELTKKEEIENIVEHVENRNKLFFNNFRKIVIDLHYTNPDVTKGLSYNGPPQPKGFMDYNLPPNHNKKQTSN